MKPVANKHVLVVSTSFAQVTDRPLQILEEHSCEIVRVRGPHSEARMAELVPGIAAVIVGIDPVTEGVLKAGSELQIVAKHGVGVDNIDVEACTRHDVLVTNVPGANSDAVAEFAICALLALTRRLIPAVISFSQGRWEGSRFIGTECSGKNLGIIGLGAVGQRVAKRAKGLGMNVMYFDVIRHQDFERAHDVIYVDREELLREADVISLHVPAIPATRNLIDAQGLDIMKPTAYLLNFSRGEVVDEEALIEALRHRRIAGAALDVFCQEPLSPTHAFFDLDNVLLTPHMAGYSQEASARTSISVAEDVARVLTGQTPRYGLNTSAVRQPRTG